MLEAFGIVGVVNSRPTLRAEEAVSINFISFLAIQDVITRVQSLEKMGQLSGVMDDRGKVLSQL